MRLTFNEDDLLARWDERGGPGRVYRWQLERSWHHLIATLLSSLAGLLVAAAALWLLGPFELSRFLATALPFLIAFVAMTALFGRSRYRREKALYDRWRAERRSPTPQP